MRRLFLIGICLGLLATQMGVGENEGAADATVTSSSTDATVKPAVNTASSKGCGQSTFSQCGFGQVVGVDGTCQGPPP